MITERPYRKPMDAARAAEELRAHASRQFDPRVVDALLGVLDESTTAAEPLRG